MNEQPMNEQSVNEQPQVRRLSATESRIPRAHLWSRFPAISLAVGVVALGMTGLLGYSSWRQLLLPYLVAWLFCTSIALGGLFFLFVHYLTGARWSVVLRRQAENAVGTMPLLTLLFVPIALFGLDELYPWANFESEVAAAMAVSPDAATALLDTEPLLAGKASFLNRNFFLVRSALYLLSWNLMAWYFRKRSLVQDGSSVIVLRKDYNRTPSPLTPLPQAGEGDRTEMETVRETMFKDQDGNGDPAITGHLQRLSGPAMLVLGLTLSFASFDWIMSLEPHWFSTLFGVYFFAGSAVAIYAFLTVMTVLLRRSGLLVEVVTTEHYHDLGKMLFGFTAFWAYIAFSQYLLIWYAGIPEETYWFAMRLEGSWRLLSHLLAWGHFVIPLFFLMSRHIKRRPNLLLIGSLWMLSMHLIDIYWLVMPAFNVLTITTLFGTVSLFLASYARNVIRAELVPLGDPELSESLAFENV